MLKFTAVSPVPGPCLTHSRGSIWLGEYISFFPFHPCISPSPRGSLRDPVETHVRFFPRNSPLSEEKPKFSRWPVTPGTTYLHPASLTPLISSALTLLPVIRDRHAGTLAAPHTYWRFPASGPWHLLFPLPPDIGMALRSHPNVCSAVPASQRPPVPNTLYPTS